MKVPMRKVCGDIVYRPQIQHLLVDPQLRYALFCYLQASFSIRNRLIEVAYAKCDPMLLIVVISPLSKDYILE